MNVIDRLRRAWFERRLLSGDVHVMAAAVDGLVQLEARDTLRAALSHRDPYVREFAAAGLADVATNDDLPRFVRLLDDRELQIADGAQAYLASVGDPALPLVVERALRQPETVSWDTVELLGLIGDADGVAALEAVVVHGNRGLRREAMDALARIGGARGKAIVENIQRTTDDQYEREHAAGLIDDWR